MESQADCRNGKRRGPITPFRRRKPVVPPGAPRRNTDDPRETGFRFPGIVFTNLARAYSAGSECFRCGKQESRTPFFIPVEIRIAVCAPTVIQPDVHPLFKFETVTDAETAKRMIPGKRIDAPNVTRTDPRGHPVATVNPLAQFDLRHHAVPVAVAPFVITAHALHAAQRRIHVPGRHSHRKIPVKVVSQHAPFPRFLIPVEGNLYLPERMQRIAEPSREIFDIQISKEVG